MSSILILFYVTETLRESRQNCDTVWPIWGFVFSVTVCFCCIPNVPLRSLSKKLSLQKQKKCAVCIQGRDSVLKAVRSLMACKWVTPLAVFGYMQDGLCHRAGLAVYICFRCLAILKMNSVTLSRERTALSSHLISIPFLVCCHN